MSHCQTETLALSTVQVNSSPIAGPPYIFIHLEKQMYLMISLKPFHLISTLHKKKSNKYQVLPGSVPVGKFSASQVELRLALLSL